MANAFFKTYLDRFGYTAFKAAQSVPYGFTREYANWASKLDKLLDAAQVMWQADNMQQYITLGVPEAKVKAIFEQCLNRYCNEIEEMDSVSYDFHVAMQAILS